MEAIIPVFLVLFFIAIFRMMWLSYLIEHLRNGGTVDTLSRLNVLIDIGIKSVNNHLWPGPFISEFHDTEEIKALIIKRNWVVGLLWLGVLVVVILQIFFHPEMPAKREQSF